MIGSYTSPFHLHPCKGCSRPTSLLALYCCRPCLLADEGHYEIHESGILGHTSSCDERYDNRRGTES